ncbi:hypothetical protein I2I05_16060 [Hymenobacter sp. BT683]|uniref:WXG100 family type VII secretion target n=1 Tax=Hymenobacter jeongseonensis TaxID=2791027 RepID=A0ABS0IKK8_9BACT|nr:hypothetical protein [Hymenobacter jeongseonensis]MBF9238919.1 hypothetical protein [Hymenobacter jeongseonensis]
MTEADQKLIDSTLGQMRALHTNMGTMWDGDAIAAFYYNVLTGAIARNGPELARPLMEILTEVYENTAKSHVDLGRLTTGLSSPNVAPASDSTLPE